MKLLTYNIHAWEGTDAVVDVDRVIEVIRASEADIVGLNEVYHPAKTAELDRPALEYMAEQLGMHFVFGQAHGFRFAFNRPARSYGNALLARWPILASAAHHLTPVAGGQQRGLLETRVLLPDGRAFTVYVTHLEGGGDETVRLAQAKSLLSWTIRDRNQPHALMGDLNTINPADYPNAASLEALRRRAESMGLHLYEPLTLPHLLKQGYVDAWTEVGRGASETWDAETQLLARIDYVLVSKPLAPYLVSCQRWDAPPAMSASDHLPVLVELDY
ncbi:MAG: hypothetical protein GXP42_14160 [Chloroflexi bacterium]|nr:hypothetical protein [Chloroflexota bacterium]